jgi:hypothetical protein
MPLNKIHPATHPDLFELFTTKFRELDEAHLTIINSSKRKNYLMINTPFHLPDSPTDVFNQQSYFRDGGFLKLLEPYYDDIKSGNTKVVFFFVDWWGFCNWKETNNELNGNLVSYDIYKWVYNHLKEQDLLLHSCFVSPQSTMFVQQYPDFPILEYNEPFNRYFTHGQAVTDTKTTPYGFTDFMFNLNRRPRPHRLYAFHEFYRYGLLDDAKYTFHYFSEEVGENYPMMAHLQDKLLGWTDTVDFNVLDYMSSNFSEDISYDVSGDMQFLEQLQNLNKVSGNCYLEAVTEYNCSNTKVFLTEKISRSIVLKNPFIVFGDRFTITELHRRGFKTFGKSWDESYDSLPTAIERIDAAIKILIDVREEGRWRKGHYDEAIQDVIEHNRNWYFGGYKQRQLDTFKRIFD